MSTFTSDVFDVNELAQRLKLSTATVRRYVRSGLLPAPLPFGRGGALRWSRKAIEQWLDRKGGAR
jgi:excisionase family DNA binding protein